MEDVRQQGYDWYYGSVVPEPPAKRVTYALPFREFLDQNFSFVVPIYARAS
jgi:hypothetical protein